MHLRAAFLAYVEQFLAPTLLPGDTVVPDPRKPPGGFADLDSHKVSGVCEAIEACGATLPCLLRCTVRTMKV